MADPTTGVTAYYQVGFAPGEMPACWNGLLLYPLGTVAFPSPVPLLPPWTTVTDALWTAAAATTLGELTVCMARLTGDRTSGANTKA